jgi:phosphoribosylanthranilate isomerase
MILKICGITRPEDALHAVAQGATALGFVFWPRSPRCADPLIVRRIVRSLPEGILTVGVFVNQQFDDVRAIATISGVSTVQLHGDERPDFAIDLDRSVWRASGSPAVLEAWPMEVTLLLDAHDPERRGGTGVRADWSAGAALAARRPLILAGGLTPDNVAAAIAVVRPLGVDVSSGVEAAPGIKNHDRVARFLAAARESFHASQH